MNVFMPFNYRAVSEEEFIFSKDGVAMETQLHQKRKEKIYFNEHRFKPFDFPKTAKVVTFYTVENDQLMELLENNPKAMKIFTDYAVQ